MAVEANRRLVNIEAVGFDGMIHPLEMTDDAPVWQQTASKYSLNDPVIYRLASPWHTDPDRPLAVTTDMSKSRKLGFTVYQDTRYSFFNLLN